MHLHVIQGLAHPNTQTCLPLPPRQRNDSCGLRSAPCCAWQQAVGKSLSSNIKRNATKPLADADCQSLQQPLQRPLAAAPRSSPLQASYGASHPSSSSPLPRPPTSVSPSANASECHFPLAASSSSPLAAPSSSRRAVLLAGASSALLLLPPAGLIPSGFFCPPAAARALHSRRSNATCSLTVRNRSPRLVEARWVNYDGDEEPYATILPGHVWAVDTFETHPWRFRDARSGDLVCEYVAQRGDRLLQLYDDPAGLLDLDLDPANDAASSGGDIDSGVRGGGGGPSGGSEWRRRQRRLRQRRPTEPYGQPQLDADADQIAASAITTSSSPPQQPLSQPPQAQSSPPAPPPSGVSERPGLAGGFDGLGNPAEQYTPATLLSVAVVPEAAQAVVVLGLGGYAHPLSLLVGLPEARGIVNAAGAARGRRPTLLATWVQTLQSLGGTLERVVITRQLGGVFYARIVLSQPWRGPGPAAAAAAVAPPQARTPQSADSREGRGGPGPAAGVGSGLKEEVEVVVSVDARPSDALALALEAGAEVFVSRPVAELVQQQYLEAEKELTDRLLPPPRMQQQHRGGEVEGLMGTAPSA